MFNRKIANEKAKIKNRDKLIEDQSVKIKNLNKNNKELAEENRDLRFENEELAELFKEIHKLLIQNTYNNEKIKIRKIKELVSDYQSKN